MASPKLKISVPDSGYPPSEKRLWLLLKTDVRASSMDLMGKLAGLPGVREVHMTEGEWSFVVEVAGDPQKAAKELSYRLSRIHGVDEAVGAVSVLKR